MHTIAALKVRQWLSEWDEFTYDPDAYSRKPPEHFYIFSMKASTLRALTGVNRRVTDINSSQINTGIQRQHISKRSADIKAYLKSGYPYSELSKIKKKEPGAEDLRKPGWLPTAVIVNILGTGEKREKSTIHKNEAVEVKDIGPGSAEIIIPFTGEPETWRYQGAHPFEVIDGQHRLWAFDPADSDDYELPVVAFYNLDISWQAYLFWVINVKPKRINPSLAYDLYPLLRTETWLQKGSNIHVYRETRAQEIVTALWSLDISPWHNNINMLGEGGRDRGITQSSWIKSLTASRSLLGSTGAFEATEYNWNISAQVAILCLFGSEIKKALKKEQPSWTKKLNTFLETTAPSVIEEYDDPAFASQYSFISTDQGMRPLLIILNNDILRQKEKWEPAIYSDAMDAEIVSALMEDLGHSPLGKSLIKLAKKLAAFDWRTPASTNKETERPEYDIKMSFRGAAGYKQLQEKLEAHLAGG